LLKWLGLLNGKKEKLGITKVGYRVTEKAISDSRKGIIELRE